jgi:hypothetical protein
MGTLSLVMGLLGKKKDTGGGALIDPHTGYRTDEQEKAVFYFSDANRQGCFAGVKGCFKTRPEKKEPVKKGCFPAAPKFKYVSDAEYDALVKAALTRLDPYHRGLQKLGLDESQVQEIKPISFSNAVYIPVPDRKADEPFYWKFGEDGVFRSSVYEVTEIYFSNSQLFAYQIRFSMDWEKHKESTREYHYKDITAFGTSTTQEDEIKDGQKVYKTKNVFTITVPNNSFRVSLCSKPNADEENSIQGMKAMLREMKA